MRPALLWNPRLLCERLAVASQRIRRLAKLKRTPAARLQCGHIGTLELLEFARRDDPRVIYDIGANVGTWTLLARSCFPRATIHAFEPLTAHQVAFERAVQSLPAIQLHKIALGRRAETLPMQVASISDSSSLLPFSESLTKVFGITRQREEKVPVVPLDHYVEAEKLPAPDLIKLDVQGYELAILEGGLRCLQAARFVISEVSFIPFYQGQPLFADVVAFMDQQGFELCALGVDTPLGQELMQTDGLFARKGSRS